MAHGQAGSVLYHVLQLIDAQGTVGLSDAQLLEQFTTRRDESAFAALMRRHARLVFGVCRRVLSHPQDAEDAFQATFLVLARNAASVRKGEALAGWLHGVALRTARSASTCGTRSAGSPADNARSSSCVSTKTSARPRPHA